MTGISQEEFDNLDIVAHAWGIFLTSDHHLYAWNCDLKSPVISDWIPTEHEDFKKLKLEIDSVAKDRLGQWPTVEKYTKYLGL